MLCSSEYARIRVGLLHALVHARADSSVCVCVCVVCVCVGVCVGVCARVCVWAALHRRIILSCGVIQSFDVFVSQIHLVI